MVWREMLYLARFARVNRQISATAIPLLWKTLQNTTPIASLLLGFRRKYDFSKLRQGSDGVLGDNDHLPKFSSVRRFEIYAPFIKELTSERDWTFDVLYPHLYEAHFHITTKAPGKSLLPRLSYLSWIVNSNESLRPLLCFVAPSITDLKIGLRDTEQVDDLPVVMERIQGVSPSIVKFGLEAVVYVHLQQFALIATCLRDLLRSQTATLHELRVDMFVFTEAVRTSPIMFPVLQHLDCRVGFWIDDEVVPDFSPPFFSTELFPRLKTFHGQFARTLDVLCQGRFIGGVGATLTEIFLSPSSNKGYRYGVDGMSRMTFTSFLTIVGHSCPILEKFSLRLVDFTEPLGFDSFLQPLHGCARLEEVILSPCGRVDISYFVMNQDVIEMTQAWKGLRVLRIFSDKPMYHDDGVLPTLDLEAIEILISQCSRLRDINLTVNATIHKAFSVHSRPRWSHPFESINFGKSPINDSGNVAIWLNNLCPWSSISFHNRGDDDPTYKMWCEVRAHVRSLQGNNGLAKAEVQELRNEMEELPAKFDAALKDRT